MNCDILAMGPLSLDVEELRHRGITREYIGEHCHSPCTQHMLQERRCADW